MAKIRCVVERVTYQNPENGYAVLKTRVKAYRDLVTVVGNMMEVPAGTVLVCEGEWKMDKRWGAQFVAKTWEEVMPATIYGIEKYLGSGLVKGIGPKFAKLIVNRFKEETINVIEDDINRLYEVPGIGTKRVEMIREGWQRQKDIKNVMLFLQSHGVSTSYAAKIFRQYGKQSVEMVQMNPYRLADDIWGIGFRTADSIASGMGYEKDDPRRLRSGLMYTLSQLSEEGHVFARREQLLQEAGKLLESQIESLEAVLDEMVHAQDLMLSEDAYYLPCFYFSETGVARKLLALLGCASPGSLFDPQVSAEQLEKKTGICYDEVQMDAIRKAQASKVMILTGGPGTGKTTTTQGIIAAYRAMGLRILLAAPTGRAAKRLSEATGMEAKTIHRLLEYNPQDGYKRNEDQPLEADALIVDECSMIDVILMHNLLKAVPLHMRLVMVGDIDQLPSVGAGNVLRDMIDSEVIPVVRLKRIFRQAQSSRIVMSAHAINEGRMPDLSNGSQADFFFISQEDPEKVASEIVNLVKTRLPNAYHVGTNAIQVLTPMQRGVVGAANLNLLLQQALNASQVGLSRGGFTFTSGDRVMQIRNNYDKEVFNGDIGVVSRVDPEDRSLMVDFDGRTVSYDVAELDELTLAYAVTIHKSQGSEYPIVVLPILMTHFVMLQRNLIYTGITRAKKICVLIGQPRALSYAIRNLTVSARNSLLRQRLRLEVRDIS